MKFGNLIIFKEEEGVLGPGRPYVAIHYDGYLYLSETFLGLLWALLTEWKHDKHLVG